MTVEPATTLSNSLRFGKHAGASLLSLVDSDRQYCHWLMCQRWFELKFTDLYLELRRLLAKRLTAEHAEYVRQREHAAEQRPIRVLAASEL